MSETGRHLYNIQRLVGDGRNEGFKRRDESITTRLRIGHTGLNYSLHKIGKHPTGKCQSCYQPETVAHVSVNCNEYNAQRDHLFQTLSKAEHISLSGLLGKTNIFYYIFLFISFLFSAIFLVHTPVQLVAVKYLQVGFQPPINPKEEEEENQHVSLVVFHECFLALAGTFWCVQLSYVWLAIRRSRLVHIIDGTSIC